MLKAMVEPRWPSKWDCVENYSGVEEENSYENYAQLCFHRKCYSAFTNKTIINRAEIRRKKAEQLEPKETCTKQEETSSETIPWKLLRSSSTQSSYWIKSKSEHILSPICIICQKEHSYYNDTVSFILSVYFPKGNHLLQYVYVYINWQIQYLMFVSLNFTEE